MAAQTRIREQPLNVVVAPCSEAAESFRSTVLAPGFVPDASLDLRYLGGQTMAQLTYTNLYLGAWDGNDREQIDHALAAALSDTDLNNVLAQYFPDTTIGTTFVGSSADPSPLPRRIYRDTVERIVAALAPIPNVVCLMLPRGAVLVDATSHGGHVELEREAVDSKHGLGGYHGSVHVENATVYYAVGVYSEGSNGIVAFDEPWKNVCATFYHELCEVRTDPDVEDAIRAGATPAGERLLGWYSPRGGEIGDIPMAESGGDLSLVMQEVPLADGSGTVPIQLMWSNAVDGPEGPISRPHST